MAESLMLSIIYNNTKEGIAIIIKIKAGIIVQIVSQI